jgi:hypothetical protein
MPVGALSIELHLPGCGSLKEKRSTLRPILEGSRARFGVAAAEVDFQDLHQRAALVFAAASASHHHVEEVLDSVERLVWSRPDAEVVSSDRRWLDDS